MRNLPNNPLQPRDINTHNIAAQASSQIMIEQLRSIYKTVSPNFNEQKQLHEDNDLKNHLANYLHAIVNQLINKTEDKDTKHEISLRESGQCHGLLLLVDYVFSAAFQAARSQPIENRKLLIAINNIYQLMLQPTDQWTVNKATDDNGKEVVIDLSLSHTFNFVSTATLGENMPLYEKSMANGQSVENEKKLRVITLLNCLSNPEFFQKCSAGKQHDLLYTLNGVLPIQEIDGSIKKLYLIENFQDFFIGKTAEALSEQLQKETTEKKWSLIKSWLYYQFGFEEDKDQALIDWQEMLVEGNSEIKLTDILEEAARSMRLNIEDSRIKTAIANMHYYDAWNIPAELDPKMPIILDIFEMISTNQKDCRLTTKFLYLIDALHSFDQLLSLTILLNKIKTLINLSKHNTPFTNLFAADIMQPFSDALLLAYKILDQSLEADKTIQEEIADEALLTLEQLKKSSPEILANRKNALAQILPELVRLEDYTEFLDLQRKNNTVSFIDDKYLKSLSQIHNTDFITNSTLIELEALLSLFVVYFLKSEPLNRNAIHLFVALINQIEVSHSKRPIHKRLLGHKEIKSFVIRSVILLLCDATQYDIDKIIDQNSSALDVLLKNTLDSSTKKVMLERRICQLAPAMHYLITENNLLLLTEELSQKTLELLTSNNAFKNTIKDAKDLEKVTKEFQNSQSLLEKFLMSISINPYFIFNDTDYESDTEADKADDALADCFHRFLKNITVSKACYLYILKSLDSNFLDSQLPSVAIQLSQKSVFSLEIFKFLTERLKLNKENLSNDTITDFFGSIVNNEAFAILLVESLMINNILNVSLITGLLSAIKNKNLCHGSIYNRCILFLKEIPSPVFFYNYGSLHTLLELLLPGDKKELLNHHNFLSNYVFQKLFKVNDLNFISLIYPSHCHQVTSMMIENHQFIREHTHFYPSIELLISLSEWGENTITQKKEADKFTQQLSLFYQLFIQNKNNHGLRFNHLNYLLSAKNTTFIFNHLDKLLNEINQPTITCFDSKYVIDVFSMTIEKLSMNHRSMLINKICHPSHGIFYMDRDVFSDLLSLPNNLVPAALKTILIDTAESSYPLWFNTDALNGDTTQSKVVGSFFNIMKNYLLLSKNPDKESVVCKYLTLSFFRKKRNEADCFNLFTILNALDINSITSIFTEDSIREFFIFNPFAYQTLVRYFPANTKIREYLSTRITTEMISDSSTLYFLLAHNNFKLTDNERQQICATVDLKILAKKDTILFTFISLMFGRDLQQIRAASNDDNAILYKLPQSSEKIFMANIILKLHADLTNQEHHYLFTAENKDHLSSDDVVEFSKIILNHMNTLVARSAPATLYLLLFKYLSDSERTLLLKSKADKRKNKVIHSLFTTAEKKENFTPLNRKPNSLEPHP